MYWNDSQSEKLDRSQRKAGPISAHPGLGDGRAEQRHRVDVQPHRAPQIGIAVVQSGVSSVESWQGRSQELFNLAQISPPRGRPRRPDSPSTGEDAFELDGGTYERSWNFTWSTGAEPRHGALSRAAEMPLSRARDGHREDTLPEQIIFGRAGHSSGTLAPGRCPELNWHAVMLT